MKHTKIYFVLILVFALTQCKDKTEEPVITAKSELEHALYSGGTPEDPRILPLKKTPKGDTSYTRDGIRWKCKTETHEINDALGNSKGGFQLFNPNANVIYPGSMLQGKSLRQATPDVIAVDRAGGTISYDIVDGNLKSFFTVDKVTKSSITDGMNNIIAENKTLPANFDINVTRVQSREQFAMEIEADFENAFIEVESKFAMETDNSYSSFLVKLNQRYYTMSFDIPTNKDQLFGPDVTAEELRKYVGEGNPATYISDVTYGRKYYLLIESTSSATEIEAAISGSFETVGNKASGSVDASYYSDIENLKIKMFAYGGVASGTLQTPDINDIGSLTEMLAEAGTIGSGMPLSYVVRSAYNNQIVSVARATQFDVTTCEIIGTDNTPPASTAQWTGLMDKLGGPVGAIMTRSDDPSKRVIVNKAGTHYVNESNGVVSSTRLSISSMFRGTVPFDSIGAMGSIRFARRSGLEDYWGEVVWNKAGNKYVNIISNEATTVFGIGDFVDDNCPFNSEGIGGMCTYTDTKTMALNKAGTKYSFYSINGWGAVNNISDFGDYMPFASVGAITQLRIGNTNFLVLFNQAGTQYCIYDETANQMSPVYDL